MCWFDFNDSWISKSGTCFMAVIRNFVHIVCHCAALLAQCFHLVIKATVSLVSVSCFSFDITAWCFVNGRKSSGNLDPIKIQFYWQNNYSPKPFQNMNVRWGQQKCQNFPPVWTNKWEIISESKQMKFHLARCFPKSESRRASKSLDHRWMTLDFQKSFFSANWARHQKLGALCQCDREFRMSWKVQQCQTAELLLGVLPKIKNQLPLRENY